MHWSARVMTTRATTTHRPPWQRGLHSTWDKTRSSHQTSSTRNSPPSPCWALRLAHPVRANERTSFSSLVELGLADSLEGTAGFESTAPRDQAELQTATRELNQSTAAIRKQTETLKQQQEALAKFAKAQINTEADRSDLDAALLQRRAAEGRNVKLLVDDLSRSLEIKVSDVKQQSDSDSERLEQNVGHVVAADDKLLTSLAKLEVALSLSGDCDDSMVDELRQACMR
jgi:septal ring factor EnvC (AmiA/AmiB activator)